MTGLASAWAMARQRTKEYSDSYSDSYKVDAASRCPPPPDLKLFFVSVQISHLTSTVQTQRECEWARLQSDYERIVDAQAQKLQQLLAANAHLRCQMLLAEETSEQTAAKMADLQERMLTYCDAKQQLIAEQIYNTKVISVINYHR